MEGGGGRGCRIGWIKWRYSLIMFGAVLLLTDLTRVKSVRACLPLGRRVTAPAQVGAAGFTSVRRADGHLPAGAAAFGNRTRRTSTGRSLWDPLALYYDWSAERANSASRSSATNASACGPSNGPENRPSRRAASKKPGAGRPPRSFALHSAAPKGRPAAASSAISASRAPVRRWMLPGPGMARRRASAP